MGKDLNTRGRRVGEEGLQSQRALCKGNNLHRGLFYYLFGTFRPAGTALTLGIRPFAVEGAGRGHWVLMDFSDVIVHIFYEPVREFYDLDGLWGDAPRAELPEHYAKLAGQF